MIWCICDACRAKLVIYENDTMPGCREYEEVLCPVCREIVCKTFTSGIPSAEVVE